MRKDMKGEQANESQADPERIEAELIELARQTGEAVEEFVADRPHAALAIAAGIGFVMGGGLTPRRLLRWGMLVAGPVITRGLTDRLVAGLDQVLGSEPTQARSASPSQSS